MSPAVGGTKPLMKKLPSPLISVLLPVYNGELYLSQAIDSILSQTIKDFELICINDGSTDNTGKILAKYAKKDKRIKIITNNSNIRMAASLNKALDIAKGFYIARMDADDISLPDRFAKQIALLESDKSLVAVGCQEQIIDEYGHIKAEKHFPTDSKLCYQTLANFMPIQPPTLMARGNIFKKYRYDTSICPNDDINIYFKLLQHGNFSSVDEILFQYRQQSSSLTHNNSKSVYFMALKNRLNGFINYNYRPSITRILLAFIETILVTLLTPNQIIKLFEAIRYISQKQQSKTDLSSLENQFLLSKSS